MANKPNLRPVQQAVSYQEFTFLGICRKPAGERSGLITALARCIGNEASLQSSRAIDASALLGLSDIEGSHNIQWTYSGRDADETLQDQLVLFRARRDQKTNHYFVCSEKPVTPVSLLIFADAKAVSATDRDPRLVVGPYQRIRVGGNGTLVSAYVGDQRVTLDLSGSRSFDKVSEWIRTPEAVPFLERLIQDDTAFHEIANIINRERDPLEIIDLPRPQDAQQNSQKGPITHVASQAQARPYFETRQEELKALGQEEGRLRLSIQGLEQARLELVQVQAKVEELETRNTYLVKETELHQGNRAYLDTLVRTLKEEETQLHASIKVLGATIGARQATLEQIERLEDDGRERLRQDLLAVRDVLETARNGVPPRRLIPSGQELTELLPFLTERLPYALASWVPLATVQDARALHLALLGCKGVLVPDPTWSRAYAEALGCSCSFSVLPVGATWVDPDTARPALLRAFQEARRNPEQLFITHVRDIDRAPMECWAVELLDALAGLHSFGSDDQDGWPSNLRFTFSMAHDGLSLPVSRSILRALGAIPLERLAGDRCSGVGPKADVFVPVQAWAAWASIQSPAHPAQSHDLGAWTRQGLRELQTLSALARSFDLPQRIAERIRIEWPEAYGI